MKSALKNEPRSSNAPIATSSEQPTGIAVPPVATKEQTSNQSEGISQQEIVKAFRAVNERMNAQDQVLIDIRNALQGGGAQAPAQGQGQASGFVYLNPGQVAGQTFDTQGGEEGRLSGREILNMIKPFITPQNPMENLMNRFFEKTIESAIDNQLASGQIVSTITKKLIEKEAGIAPRHDHAPGVEHRTAHRRVETQEQ